MTSVDRILQFIDKQRISKRAFYNSVGVSNGYLDKTKTINSDVLAEIIYNYPDLNIQWLITGEGEMLKNDENHADTHTPNDTEYSTNGEYITITPATKSGVQTTKRQKLDPATDPPTRILTPQFITVDRSGNENILYVSVRARAGYLNGYGDAEFIEKLPSFNLPGLPQGSYRAFELEGDSMLPTLKNREMVIGQWVEKLEYIREDRVYILVTKTEGVIIKRLLNRIEKHGLIIAKSDATNDRELYQNIPVKPEDIQEIWYAVWHGGFDFQSPSDMWKRVNNHEADLTVLQNTVNQLTQIIKSAGLLNKGLK